MQTQSPWANESKQTDGQVGVGGAQPQVIAGQPTNQQVIYVQAPAFKPSPNFRHISYMVLGIGIAISLLFEFITDVSGSEIVYRVRNSMCCIALGVVCILDAMYYNDKSTWQTQTGSDATSSSIGIIVDIILAIGCLGMALFFLLMP